MKMQDTLNKLISGELKNTDKLKLSCNLDKLPNEVFSLADTLEVLDLSNNNFSELPEDFECLQNLKILFLSENKFKLFPKILSKCKNLDIIGFKSNEISYLEEECLPPNLRWLILTNNKISNLPKSIGNCKNLQKLMLAGNYLTTLPDTMIHCKNLELLRISANRLNELPNWIFDLPKLSWLAFASNPCLPKLENTRQVTKYVFQDFKLEKLIGEGASGSIYEVKTANTNNPHVAVKIFKGEITSDGFPEDEMSACLQAGIHPNLTNVLGEFRDKDKQGLVLELISENYKKLGYPPNFDTCTRDTFPENISFSIPKILQILLSISAAMTHLHQHGILHGDLYAHNILVEDTNFHTILGDFGAATIYFGNFSQNFNFEKLEVRAFGNLMDDLLTRVPKDIAYFEIYKILIQLKDECINQSILERPNFIEVNNRLKKLI